MLQFVSDVMNSILKNNNNFNFKNIHRFDYFFNSFQM